MNKITPVAELYRQGLFASVEHAKGAFDLAWRQYNEGLGDSAEQWMGLTRKELEQWRATKTLPKRRPE